MDLKNLKYNKIWLAKDKYIYRAGFGEHWFLKKFMVLYKIFLVDREKINEETFKEITLNFEKFISSIRNPLIKSEAEKFFFSPVDFRNFDKIINFEYFNDIKEHDDSARKYFIVYLMQIGMQSGIKKAIGNLLYTNSNIKISHIFREIPRLKEQEIKYKKQEGKTPRSISDSTYTIFTDFHAEIRNYRQLLSYFGLLPPEEDGYEMNEIGKLIFLSDSNLLMAIWEHQKIKMRYGNPYSRSTISQNPEKEYNKKEDFEDFKINPYIAIIETLYRLYLINKKEAYLDFEEYKFFICREAPFICENIIKKILEYRKLSAEEKDKIKDLFDNRPKTRAFSLGKEKSPSDDFLKELSNFLYGLSEYSYLEDKKNNGCIVRYKSQKVEIIDEKNFVKISKILIELKNYMDEKYSELYENISNYSSLKLIDDIFRNCQGKDKKYLLNLANIRQKLLEKYGGSLDDFYDLTLNNWKNYISIIDYQLLTFCYTYYLLLKKYPVYVPLELTTITGIDKNILNKIIDQIIVSYVNEDNSFLNSFKIIIPDKIENISEISLWLESQIKGGSYSVVKQRLKKEENDLLYSFENGNRIRKRNLKMMMFAQKERLENNIVMEVSRPNYPINNCDSCNKQFDFKIKEPQCHHIIPFEILGPDTPLNYAFLCENCHKIFTHKTLKSQKIEAISNLKKKGIIKKESFEKMIKYGDLKIFHLDFLHREGYINIVDKIELRKLLKTTKYSPDDLDNFFSKIYPSKKRWSRAMIITFWYRTKHKLIMEKVIPNYSVNSCDSCNKEFSKKEPECHHIIPKHNLGPESPFNYTYLCNECHKQLTFKRKNKKQIIENLKKNGIVTEDTIKQMILDNLISKAHLEFLKNENYLSNKEIDNLIDLQEEMKKYW